MICPKCGKENDDNWPLDIDGEIREGGCQMCWETECSDAWWQTVIALETELEKMGICLDCE